MGFYRTDNSFIDDFAGQVGLAAVGVYDVLQRHSGGKKGCFPSVSLIAKKLRIGERQVRRGIRALQARNLISISRVNGRKNRYTLNSVDLWRSMDAVDFIKGKESDAPFKLPAEVYYFDVEGKMHRGPTVEWLAQIKFPDEVFTCDHGHSWDEDDGRGQGRCTKCGLLRAEEYYKQMVPPEERGGYGSRAEMDRDLPF